MPRQHYRIEGIVQGVGFRPFVFRAARSLGLAGWVLNDSRGVEIEVEGAAEALAAFRQELEESPPPLAAITAIGIRDLPEAGERDFSIRPSADLPESAAQVAPDSFVCEDCLRELFDPADRRYRYPFINCTNCGPRFTIITAVPYDRPNTTMAGFPLCDACRREYEDPADRRFHAQPVACPACGPRLALHGPDGAALPAGDPLAAAVAALADGKIVAVKGLGGYHLAADARNDAALAELRRRKGRDEKPFALMVPGLEQGRRLAEVGPVEERLLASVERPIVLLRRRPGDLLSPLVAPRNRFLGVMLPYTPLHYLLLEERFESLVMTSANLSDEPIVFRDEEAFERLGGIADLFLAHDRPIRTRTDDSIARVVAGQAMLLRRARGFVPRSLQLPAEQPSVLAVGAELKSVVCLTRGDRAFLSQHIGDLKNEEVSRSLGETVRHLREILELEPAAVAHDLHPDYLSTRYAESLEGLPRIGVQHHHAHLAGCLAEHREEGEAIGMIFDGLGYGSDGTLWGGEFLVGGAEGYRRAGHFACRPLPGGDAATREPWRMALSYLRHACGEALPPLPLVERIPAGELRLLLQMIDRGINAPPTSSCGRLFDAVAALAGVRERVGYEGQAALELEQAVDEEERGSYPWQLAETGEGLIFEPDRLILAVVDDVLGGASAGRIAARFHNALAGMIREACLRLRETTGLDRVVLSGGVFQNRCLTERSVALLEPAGFRVLTHALAPPNDGGLALGQAVVAGRSLARGR